MSGRHMPWRWSAVPMRFLGLHGSIAAFFPLLILTSFICLCIHASSWWGQRIPDSGFSGFSLYTY